MPHTTENQSMTIWASPMIIPALPQAKAKTGHESKPVGDDKGQIPLNGHRAAKSKAQAKKGRETRAVHGYTDQMLTYDLTTDGKVCRMLPRVTVDYLMNNYSEAKQGGTVTPRWLRNAINNRHEANEVNLPAPLMHSIAFVGQANPRAKTSIERMLSFVAEAMPGKSSVEKELEKLGYIIPDQSPKNGRKTDQQVINERRARRRMTIFALHDDDLKQEDLPGDVKPITVTPDQIPQIEQDDDNNLVIPTADLITLANTLKDIYRQKAIVHLPMDTKEAFKMHTSRAKIMERPVKYQNDARKRFDAARKQGRAPVALASPIGDDALAELSLKPNMLSVVAAMQIAYRDLDIEHKGD